MKEHEVSAETNVRPFARETARLVSGEEQQKLGLTAGLVNGHTVLTTPFPEWP